MQNPVRCVSNESGSRCGDSETSNTEEEEERSRMKHKNYGGSGAVVGGLRGNSEHSVEHTPKAVPQSKRRNFQRHQILHPREPKALQYASPLVTSPEDVLHLTLTVTVSATPLPPISLSTELPIESTVSQTTYLSSTPSPPSRSSAINVPTTADVLPTTPGTSPVDSTRITSTFTTITSFVSNFAPNATTSRTTREGTVIVITPSGARNLTRTITNAIAVGTSTSLITVTSTSTTALEPVSTVVYGAAPVPSLFNTPPPATSSGPTSSSNVPGGGGTTQPVQPKMLGGILGGLAGLGLMFFVILLLIKRRKRRSLLQAQDDAGYGGPLPASSQSMVERSMSLLGAARLLPRYHRPAEDPEPQERGFVRVSGRKLPPVLGGPRPEYGSMRSAGEASSYYRDDDHSLGAPGAPATPVSSYGPGRHSSPPPPSPSARPACTSRLKERFDNIGEDEVGGTVPQGGPFRSPNRSPLYLRQFSGTGSDGVGRSLISQDGSKTSRFTEDVT